MKGYDYQYGTGNQPGSSNQGPPDPPKKEVPKKKYKPHRSMTRYGHYEADPLPNTSHEYKQFDAPSPDLEDRWVN